MKNKQATFTVQQIRRAFSRAAYGYLPGDTAAGQKVVQRRTECYWPELLNQLNYITERMKPRPRGKGE
jgi:hypothetical protein